MANSRIYQKEHLDVRGHFIKGKIRKTNTTTHKYESFSPDGGRSRIYVHRAVAMSFLGIPDGNYEVNHKDGNTRNNKVENLEWCSRLDNIRHSRIILNRHPEDAIKKPVFCIELQKWFPSIKDAAKVFNKTAESLECLNKKGKTFAGYHWATMEVPYIKTKYTSKGKKWVKCIETGELFEGCLKLAKNLGVNGSTLREAIKTCGRCKGKHYTYL